MNTSNQPDGAPTNAANKGEAPLISVKNLHVCFATPKGPVHAVRGISFDLGRERLGIVGESGSGKSQTGRALLRLTAGNGSIEADELLFDGMDLMRADEKCMRSIRGSRISMIMQDPKYSLNPVMTVGAQIAESCRQHETVSKSEAKQRALAMLETVRIREPEKVYRLYPHQVSGGMGQRIMIAMMLITNPQVMIADEPTSALDVTVQMQVLALLDDMVRERGMGLVLISHDLHLVSSFCDRVLVMYGGRIMESLDAKHLDRAKHPYTKGLLNCLPRLDGTHSDLPVLKRDPAWMTDDLDLQRGEQS
ncbi:ABC transporter ATP-binding protein [Cohaesibacter celericrescens]|uniref:Peptide ABC transporter ATP-binding protein n=1 Tax=Cohaesibacter celericrescens TaxID=2067669 RepID=A0A2N5XVG2_9HYPH|nr:ABC transporter ATP-binding protein [Cohaesibacter celericrescens]PLW78501.1 peptide ABC transporter ATP-binding protein [Cohaesibacter celericrescens]